MNFESLKTFSRIFIASIVILLWMQTAISSPTVCKIDKLCPPGSHPNHESRNYETCCECCMAYKGYNQSCRYANLCSPSLKCLENEKRCTYIWENNFKIDCHRVDCPRISSCPDKYFLLRGRKSEQHCCDKCYPNSQLGEYCDRHQPCYSKLQCTDNTCTESLSCSFRSCQDDLGCRRNEYLIQRNGLDYCCDRCHGYAGLGDTCNECLLCGQHLRCNQTENICRPDFASFTSTLPTENPHISSSTKTDESSSHPPTKNPNTSSSTKKDGSSSHPPTEKPANNTQSTSKPR